MVRRDQERALWNTNIQRSDRGGRARKVTREVDGKPEHGDGDIKT